MSFVITIGREYGSGGRYIASELAKKLNVNFYDGKLLEKVAEKAGFSLDYFQSKDEKKDNDSGYRYDADNYVGRIWMS